MAVCYEERKEWRSAAQVLEVRFSFSLFSFTHSLSVLILLFRVAVLIELMLILSSLSVFVVQAIDIKNKVKLGISLEACEHFTRIANLYLKVIPNYCHRCLLKLVFVAVDLCPSVAVV